MILKSLFSVFLILITFALCLGQNLLDSPRAIFDAIKNNDIKQVLMLLDKGVDVNLRGELDYTPLLAAVRYNRIDIAQALCKSGADINITARVNFFTEEWGYSPLLWAAKNCNVDMAELLIANGATVAQRGREGDLPLIIAARSGCLPVVKMFITAGAVIDAEDEENGDTALIEAVSRGYLDLADYLIEKGADIKRRSQGGRSLLLLAAFRGHFAEVIYFHEKGFSLNEKDNLGLTAAHYAANDFIERLYILDYIITHEGPISARSMTGVTPIMEASLNGANLAINMLITNGAVVDCEDNDKNTPLHYVCQGRSDSRPSNRSTKREETLLLLLNNGAKVNRQNKEEKTPLMDAARYQPPNILKILLKHGAAANTKDEEGWTALMYAAAWNRTEAIKVLVDSGADMNLRNAEGQTALDVAGKKSSSAQAYALLKSLGAK